MFGSIGLPELIVLAVLVGLVLLAFRWRGAGSSTSMYCPNCGTVGSSVRARHSFARQTGYPNGRPGWIVYHVVPLAYGGADAPSNMAWQTIAEAKAKDKVEPKGC
jgi:hypothetical protein